MTMYNTDNMIIGSDKPLNANINLVNLHKNDYIQLLVHTKYSTLILTNVNTIVNIVDIYSRLHHPNQVTTHMYKMFICSDKALNANKNPPQACQCL